MESVKTLEQVRVFLKVERFEEFSRKKLFDCLHQQLMIPLTQEILSLTFDY